jgi:hypothetical protein
MLVVTRKPPVAISVAGSASRDRDLLADRVIDPGVGDHLAAVPHRLVEV